jgi:hypothetical protein
MFCCYYSVWAKFHIQEAKRQSEVDTYKIFCVLSVVGQVFSECFVFLISLMFIFMSPLMRFA